MFNDFIEELKKVLIELGVEDIERYVDDFTARFNVLRAAGKSEFESVLALGDPVANAYAIAGRDYSADEQIANNLLNSEENSGSSVDSVSLDKKTVAIAVHKPLTNGEKVFYGVLVAIAAVLIIAFVFVTALIGIISIGYVFLAWFDFTGYNRIIVFGFAIAGLFLFAIFAVIAAAIIYKIYRFTADNLIVKKVASE